MMRGVLNDVIPIAMVDIDTQPAARYLMVPPKTTSIPTTPRRGNPDTYLRQQDHAPKLHGQPPTRTANATNAQHRVAK